MIARLRSWWQKIKRPLLVVVIIAVFVMTIVLIFVEVRVYGTGFRGKTLWDWLQLAGVIAIPVAVAVYSARQNHDFQIAQELRKAEFEISTDNQREALLQAYFDKMSELILNNDLHRSAKGSEVQNIAQVRTLTILPRLDAMRKRNVLQFLYESGFIEKGESIIDLNGADLSEALQLHLFGGSLPEGAFGEELLSL